MNNNLKCSLEELEDIESIFALADIETISAEVRLYLNWSCISDIPDAQYKDIYNRIIRQVKKQAV